MQSHQIRFKDLCPVDRQRLGKLCQKFQAQRHHSNSQAILLRLQDTELQELRGQLREREAMVSSLQAELAVSRQVLEELALAAQGSECEVRALCLLNERLQSRKVRTQLDFKFPKVAISKCTQTYHPLTDAKVQTAPDLGCSAVQTQQGIKEDHRRKQSTFRVKLRPKMQKPKRSPATRRGSSNPRRSSSPRLRKRRCQSLTTGRAWSQQSLNRQLMKQSFSAREFVKRYLLDSADKG